MLYILTAELNGTDRVYVSSRNPDTNDYEDVLVNSFITTLGNKKISAEIAANVIRNILVEGGCECQMM